MDKQLGTALAALRDAADTVRTGGELIDLGPYVDALADLCKNLLSDEDVSFAIAIVFDEDAGIFSIVESLVPLRDNSVARGREKCWHFLRDFVEKIGPRALPYALLIKEKSLMYFRRDDAKSVQTAALTPLIALLEANAKHLTAATIAVNPELCDMLVRELRKSGRNNTCKGNILQLLGDFVESFKEIFEEENVFTILKLCLSTLKEQLHSDRPTLALMAGAIKCLDSLLTWFDDSLPAGGSVENSRLVFTYIEQVLLPRDELRRYDPLKACLRLLSRHAGLFGLRLIEDGVRYMHWLQEYCTHANAKIRDAALPAYDQFITQVSSSLVSDNRIRNAQTLYKAFVKDALDVLDTQDAEPKKVSLAIRAIGKLAAAIVKFSGKESLKEAFHRLEPFGTSIRAGEGREGSLGYAVTLVGAFADIIVHLDNVEDFMVTFIAQVTGNIFYQFPQLFAKQKQAVYTTLRSLLKALYSKGTIYSLFLNNIVWSSLQRAMEPVDEAVEEGSTQLWNHYVELWSRLLEFPSDQGLQLTAEAEDEENFGELVASDVGNLGISEATLSESVFDAIMQCVIKAMTELNLKYNAKPPATTASNTEVDTGPLEPEAEMDAIIPLNMIHMRKFLNLVEFVQGLLSGPCAPLLQKWTYPFGRCVIELSSRYPLISGFYKLLAVNISTADREGFFLVATERAPDGDDSLSGDRQLCKELFSRYLQEVLVASRRYKLELLAACLRLCLSAPPVLVGIASIVPSLKNALKIGIRYLPLAEVALDALERWQTIFPDQLQQWLPMIVPCLNDYLVDVEKVDVSGAETSAEADGASTSAPTTANVSRVQLAQIKRARAKDAQPGPFEIIQVRVQRFLGRIGGFAHLLVSEVDLVQMTGTGGLAWDPVERVKFNLPFRHDKPDIWLDSLLPRIVEIALSSSDRRMKVTACELLQAICLLMLGNAAKGPMRRRGEESQSAHFDKIYKRVFPAILRLATDVELVTRQLFMELTKQLIHWFTSNQQKENPDTMALLDAILDGLVDPESGSLREFCADCFSEFMRWSVRHAPPEADNFVNVTSMLRRVYNRMDHPNPYHRLGAAMAAFRMYPVLRENAGIVDRHIFEILFFCIKGLRLGELDDEQTGSMKQMNKTVDQLQKLITRNITLLRKNRKDRLLFVTLEDFLLWVFEQTGLLQEKCRSKCMMLFCSVFESNLEGSSADWFHEKLGSGGKVGEVVERFDVGMEYPNPPSLQKVRLWLSKFVRSIHWFVWALKGKLISVEELLDFERDSTIHIAYSISSFLQSLLESPESMHTFLDLTPGEQKRFQNLRQEGVIHLLNLFNQVSDAHAGFGETLDVVLRTLFLPDKGFQDLLCHVLLKPRRLGFVLFDPQRAQDLAKLATKVFKRLTDVSSTLKAQMVDSLRAVVSSEDLVNDLNNLSSALNNSGESQAFSPEDVMCLVKGCRQLSQFGILQAVLGKTQAENLGYILLRNVFQVKENCPPSSEPIGAEMVGLAMTLGVKITRLLELVFNEQPIAIATNRNLTAGEVFYMNFRIPIVQQIKFSYKECLRHLLEAAVGKQAARMLLLALLEDYSSGSNIIKGSFLQEFLQHVAVLAPLCGTGSSLQMRQYVLEIFHKLLILDTGKNFVLDISNPSFNFIIETYLSFLSCSSEESTNSSFGSSASFTLKCASMSLLAFFFSANVPAEVQRSLARILTGIVTEHLLVREADIPRGSTQRSKYTQLLSQLLGAISVSQSLELLEVVFPLLQTPNIISSKAVIEAVEVFAETLGDKREAAFDLCLGVITDNMKSAKLRRSVVDVVFTVLVNSAPAEFVTEWFSQRIKEFPSVLQRSSSIADAEKEFEDLSNKICHYRLLDLLYSKSDTNLIEKFVGSATSSELLKQASPTAHAKGEPEYKMFPENSSTWRELHTAAYNFLAAYVLCVRGSEEKFFNVLLFSEKSLPLWRHLVDLSKVYDDMPVETSQLSVASLTIKGMRADRKARRSKARGTMSQMTATISSQYMISGSLSQEPAVIKSFMGGQRKESPASASLGGGLLLDEEPPSTEADVEATEQGPSDEIVEATALDRDDFDQHECMGVVLRVIEHLHIKFGASYRPEEMPVWMKSLHAIFENAATHVNVRLFLAKVITKARKIFAPYAVHWVRPYIQTILNDPRKSGGMKFHYMLRDICITTLQWNMTLVPDGRLATRFVRHLMNVAAHGSNQVLHANIDIIRLFLENWKESIVLERRPLIDYLIAGGRRPDMNDKNIKMQRSVGLQLLGAVVASGFPIYDPVSDSSTSEAEMCEALLNNLSVQTKEVYEAAAELLGIAMKHRREKSSEVEGELLEKHLHKTMKQLYRDADYERFFNILNKVTIRDPGFLEGYATMVVDQLPRLFGAYKVNAMDTLLRHPKADPNLFNQILRSLPRLLAHRDEVAQLKILQLLSVLLKDITELDKISERVLPVLCDTFNRHESVECRREFHEILMYLFRSKGMDKEPQVLHSLLMGLCDSSDVVRGSLQTFWHSHLAQDVRQRFSELVNRIYDPGLEENWAQISNVLMLKLCEDSVDFKRPIFSAPLSDCVFHDYTINTSWMGASLPMTPLFSSSQMTQGAEGDDGDREFGATQNRPRMIRATMAPSLSQTLMQTQGGSLSSSQGVSGSALFALSQRPGGVGYSQPDGQEGVSQKDLAMNLRRRILSPRVAHSQVLSGVLRANRRREARSALQSLERANKVHMMRQYRTGELPDIEIKHADVIGPLSGLAERDPTFARLLLDILCVAVFSLQSKGPNTRAEIRQGLEAALERTNNGISFVGCVETLCLRDPEIWIPPKVVGSASRKSTNYHSGILLLEKEILNETCPEPEPNASGKRQKGRGGQVNRPLRPLEDAWVELAELYKALGENDIVLGLFKMHIAKCEKTHKALEYQLGGNLEQALRLYDEAVTAYEDGSLGGEITKSEIDIWYSQRLICLADLSNWKMIMDDIVYEIAENDGDEPDFNRLWEPANKENYLGYFIRGALRESAYHTPLTEFVQSSSVIPAKRQILMDEFSTQLATLAAITKDWDRTRFHLGQCYRVFRRQWTALNPLALEARHLRVRQLQKTVELEEFINCISKAEEEELPRLLGGWHKRWPSPDSDDVEAWDDVAQNRLLFFNHIQEHFNQQVQGSGASVIPLLNEERAHLYIEVGSGLMACGAFHASQSYLTNYLDSKLEFAGSYRRHFSNVKALVRLKRLQAERAESASDKVKMLHQVLGYVQDRRKDILEHPEFLPEFQMMQADISAEVAWATLSSLPTEGAISQEVAKCFSFLGSAYKAYSTVLPHDDPLSRNTATETLPVHDTAKALLKFGLFCDELYKLPQHLNGRSEMTYQDVSAGLPLASELPQLIVRHMLKALALDSTLQAQHAVARLVSLVGLTSETRREFENLVENVTSWVFVPWIPQILANIEEDSGYVLVKVLESIARAYPQSLYFPFHVSEADLGATGRQRTQHLKSLLRNPLLEGLVRALEDLTYPEQRLKDALNQIMDLLVTGNSERAQLAFKEIFEECLNTQVLKDSIRRTGEWNLKFAREWAPLIVKELGENGSKLWSMDTKQSVLAIRDILKKLEKSDISAEKLSLGTLSKWLADFDRTKGIERVGRDSEFNDMQIEIPGQYNSFDAPNLSSHIQLVGFDQVLVCMRSKQRPKILTMRGSDEKDYKFVVKGGEDLRLDQRIEQLFEVMNNVLHRDASCSKRKLAVRTYSVIPVSKKCGLLQFVENTTVLQDIIRDGLSSILSSHELEGSKPRIVSADEKMIDVQRMCMRWVQEKGGSKQFSESYCNMYRKVGFGEVSQTLKALEDEIPRHALRMGFARLVTSAESYLALRSHFARSLSVVSICGYVAGVGDRHLSNTLVDLRSGALVPIDFGYSFGTNVLILPVPELVPFRLTAQLRNVLLPLDAVSLLRNDMVRIMSALHGSRALIAAVMEVFVKEPLVDWKKEALRLERTRARDVPKSTSLEDAGGNNLGASNSQEEYVHLKVETAQCKLNLWNPAEITISEVRSSVHANKPYTSALEEIVRGDRSRNRRARAGTVCQTVQEQVDCLLDQATDPNLLGRIYFGWQPWV